METIKSKNITLKQILKDNWCSFLDAYHLLIPWYVAYNVWKVINCREPDGLGYATFSCPVHPSEFYHIPRTCKSRFCSICAKVQIDKWVSDMNQLFPNCSYFHITFTVPEQFRTLLFEKRTLLNAVFSASTETIMSFCKEQGFLPAITAVLHTFGSDLKCHVHIHCIVSAGGLKLTGKAERMTRYHQRKKKNPKAKKKKVFVEEKNPQWIECRMFPYKMLHKRYQTNNGSKVLYTLKTLEFIKNLIQHIPPHYFHVIRHYGILANRVKSKFKEINDPEE